MFSNFSTVTAPQNASTIHKSLSFKDYILTCQNLIKTRRLDLQSAEAPRILAANSPFELNPPETQGKYKYGVLLVHGLLDCPFSLRDLAERLHAKGIFCRAVLLPGHGTTASDLTSVTYQQWLQTVAYGIESMRDQVEQLFIAGYSTGAALAVCEAFRNDHLAGIILLSPAIKLKAPVDIVVGWHYLVKFLLQHSDRAWAYREPEIDYAKYHSIPFNAVRQVSMLTNHVSELGKDHALHSPILMILSQDDETISCQQAVNFFSHLTHARSKLLLYSSKKNPYQDKRIIIRNSYYPKLHIDSFSHISIPFAPNNFHYGANGDYTEASHSSEKELIFGAYNRIEVRTYRSLYNLGLVKQPRRELTYNPDFDFMSDSVLNFILEKK